MHFSFTFSPEMLTEPSNLHMLCRQYEDLVQQEHYWWVLHQPFTDDSRPLLDALRKCTLQHSVNVNLFSSMSVLYWPIQVLQFIHVPCIITFSRHEITITDVSQRWQTANPSLIYLQHDLGDHKSQSA